jgi:hypothetical protein
VKQVIARRARRAATAPLHRAPATSWILRLQRTAGNRAVRHLLQRDIAVHQGSHLTAAEIIYGWTEPDTVTNQRDEKRGLVVIITEIDVTTADGRHKVFHPGPDEMAEAVVHEIGVHAGRIAQGRSDTHSDTDSSVRDVVNEIGGFFRPASDKGELETSPLTRQIFAFVSGAKR